MLRAFATDELGLVKAIEAPSDRQIDLTRVVQTWGKANRGASINSLSTAGTEHIAVGRAAGVDVLSASTGAVQGFLPTATGQEDRSPAGVCLLSEPQNSCPALLSCSRGGHLRLHHLVQTDNGSALSFDEQLSLQAAPNVECVAVHAADAATSIALACHGSELGIWDVHQQQRSYLAKGNKPNRIGLVDRPWNTAVAFLPGSQGQRAIVGTFYHKLRLYDVKSRRPALDVEFGEAKITALAPQSNGLQVWAANGMGKIECLDLRMNKMQGSLKGAAGAVRSMALHPQLPIMASVGLDRFLRLHNVKSNQLLCKLYLKSQLTNVAWADVTSQEVDKQEDTDGTLQPTPTVDAQQNGSDQVAVETARPTERSNGKRSASHKKGKSRKKQQKLTEST